MKILLLFILFHSTSSFGFTCISLFPEDEIALLRIRTEFPQVPFLRYTDLNPVPRPKQRPHGVGYKDAFRATYEFVPHVWVKVSRVKTNGEVELRTRNTNDLNSWLNELDWVIMFSEMKLGPKFLGVTISPEQNLSIVTEFIQGRDFRSTADWTFLRSSRNSMNEWFKPTKQLFDRLVYIREILVKHQIGAKELQLRIHESGAWIIDPEYYIRIQDPRFYPESELSELDLFIEWVRRKLDGKPPRGGFPRIIY